MLFALLGGVWTNVEDEILKVAVMKYGRNQWARISSLLVRKTPKQCKARWNEWLDPRIRKTEWSREEDEKLLHLAKVFPSQWGTISDLVGRTAQMCLERYEKLLDEAAAGKEGSGDGASTSASLADVRKLRPGEVDPSPETKPARPDPVDMDEDEKEMLAEARARLANTQGKKAKRKAREMLLDEARRAAALQKRKELIAAGLPGIAFRHRGMDYNAEIPFERKPAPGLYDVTEELAEEAEQIRETAREKRVLTKSKDALELAARRQDVQKDRARVEKGFLPAALERKLKEQQVARRAALSLPAPQIDEADLEQIAKHGLALTDPIGGTPYTSAGAGTPLKRGEWATPLSSTLSSTSSNSRFRDRLGLNASVRRNLHPEEPLDSSSLVDAMNRNRLRNALKSLPKPKNDFDIIL